MPCMTSSSSSLSSSSIQFWSGFIPVNGGGWIYPSSNLSNSHSPSRAIHSVLFLQTKEQSAIQLQEGYGASVVINYCKWIARFLYDSQSNLTPFVAAFMCDLGEEPFQYSEAAIRYISVDPSSPAESLTLSLDLLCLALFCILFP